jgi:hypothetical protein
MQQIELPRDIQVLELQAKLPKRDFQGYRATLLDADGSTVLTEPRPGVDKSGAETDVIGIRVPVRLLTPGQYQLNIDGFYADGRSESAASYRFVLAIPRT